MGNLLLLNYAITMRSNVAGHQEIRTFQKKYDRILFRARISDEQNLQRDFSETTKSGTLGMESRSYGAHGGRSYFHLKSGRIATGWGERVVRETQKTRWAAIKIRPRWRTNVPFRGLSSARWRVRWDAVPRVRETISAIVRAHTRAWTSGGAKLRDLGGSGIFHFAGYWTDGGPSGENDRWVSVGNLTRIVDDALDAQLRRIRAYGGWTSWNPGLELPIAHTGWLAPDSKMTVCERIGVTRTNILYMETSLWISSNRYARRATLECYIIRE